MPHSPNGLLDVHPIPKIIQDPAIIKAGFSHKSDDRTLFEHIPIPSDVRQGNVGDCYYLAAALAILHKPSVPAINIGTGVVHTQAQISGAEFIEYMMKDHLDKTVTVRLFRKDVYGIYQPEYLRVRKTFVQNDQSKPPRAHNTVWVKVLEKAWAAYANQRSLPLNYFETIAANSGTAGVTPDAALAAFLGSDPDTLAIRTQDVLKLPWGDINPTNLFMVPPSPPLQQRLNQIRDSIFNGNVGLFNLWIAFLKQHAADIFGKTEFRREDFDKVADANNMDAALRTHLDAYFDRERLLPGKRGTGIYTEQQLQIFAAIGNALTARKAVELTSRTAVGIADRVGHSAGEPVTRGLVGKHAYAVTAVRVDPQPPNRKWILIRNPWGETGRTYSPHPEKPDVLKAVQQGGGEFWLELADLTKRFQVATVGGVLRQL
jgi:hypothetical protein